MPRKVNLLLARCIVLFASLFGLAERAVAQTPAPCERQWRVLGEHPHDHEHFTQGLVVIDGRLFESTGLYGRSAVHEVERQSGRSLRTHSMPDRFFGEGLAHIAGRLFQLSWREQTAMVYDLELKPLHTFRYPGEGWGLTSMPTREGERLVLSDGTPWLRILDPQTLAESARVAVTVRGQPVTMLNELEYVHGEILANLWHSDEVAVIDPASGEVRGWFNFASLRAQLAWPGAEPAETDLNGLAYDERSGRLLVTGKRWPRLFELEIGGCKSAPDDQ